LFGVKKPLSNKSLTRCKPLCTNLPVWITAILDHDNVGYFRYGNIVNGSKARKSWDTTRVEYWPWMKSEALDVGMYDVLAHALFVFTIDQKSAPCGFSLPFLLSTGRYTDTGYLRGYSYHRVLLTAGKAPKLMNRSGSWWQRCPRQQHTIVLAKRNCQQWVWDCSWSAIGVCTIHDFV
jgi:hypothetical protein